MANPIIEVQDLCFDYPGFRALHQVSFEIEPGSVTALVGPNGAGKTTLLRCIAALDTPVSGSIRVAGYPVDEAPRDVHRLMGYLSDSFGLYEELTLAQSLEYAALAQGLPRTAVAKAVEQTAQRLGLEPKLKHQARTLSRGQRQRLGIGQAIIHSPRLLLLDEPASGLDPEARGALAQVFRELQAQGMTILVSSHILAELNEYSTDMLALDQGQILEHRRLQPLSEQTERVLQLQFLEKTEQAILWLQTQPQIQRVRQQEQSLLLDFNGSAADQADLLARCLQAGLPLLSFSVITENLQQSYLSSLANKRATPSFSRMPS